MFMSVIKSVISFANFYLKLSMAASHSGVLFPFRMANC